MKVFEKDSNSSSSKAIVRQLNKQSGSPIDNLNLSLRLQEFVLNYRSGGRNAAIAQLKIDGYPIIEKTENELYKVTFIYIGDESTKNVIIASGFNWTLLSEENRFNPIANTTIWYKTFNLDPRIHCSYALLINVSENALNTEDQDLAMQLLPKFIPDPLNINILMTDCSIIKLPLAQYSDFVLDEVISVARAKKEFDFRFERSHFLEACPEDNYAIADNSVELLLYKVTMCEACWLDDKILRKLFNFDENNRSVLLSKIEKFIKQSHGELTAEQIEFINLKTHIEKIVQGKLATSQILQQKIFDTLEPMITKMRNHEMEYWFNVYTPKNFDSARASKYPVMLIFDGYANFHHTNVQFSLDKLSESGKCDEMILVFMEAERPGVNKFDARVESLGWSDHFPDILKDKLLPYLQRHFNVSEASQDTFVYGQSLGGVAAMNCALRHPLIFSNVLSHSGAFWHHKLHREERKEDRRFEGLLEKLKELEKSPDKIMELKKVNFYLSVGEFEYKKNYDPVKDEICLGRSNDHLVEHMRANGYCIKFCKQYGTGHDYAAWRVQFPEDLLKLVVMKLVLNEALENKSSVCSM